MIFLSASIPFKERDQKYIDTADVVAIRDAVKALATVVIPKSHLIWGGHPAITPLIRHAIRGMKQDIKNHVTLYQSNYFVDMFPEDNNYFENLVIVPKATNRDDSLKNMRLSMMKNNFRVGIFIGGMEGVEEEYELFRNHHPNALILPIASTGAAARIIYNTNKFKNERLESDYAYMALFRYLLKDYIEF